MEAATRTLWLALGQPTLRGLLPTARSPEWCAVRKSLTAALRTQDLQQRIRSPSSLWNLLHCGTPPPGSTWEALIGHHSLDHLCQQLRANIEQAGIRLACWNLHWLVPPHTDQAMGKRALIRHWLEAGRIVLLQETHWTDVDIAVWETAFPAATVLAAPATLGPRGGPQGGVAILLPEGC